MMPQSFPYWKVKYSSDYVPRLKRKFYLNHIPKPIVLVTSLKRRAEVGFDTPTPPEYCQDWGVEWVEMV